MQAFMPVISMRSGGPLWPLKGKFHAALEMTI